MAATAPAAKSDVLLRLFRERNGRPLRVLAPMVDQSELPFRMLTRRYGADLCYTPMIHARMTVESPSYLDKNFSTHPDDRPLVAQFCGNDPDLLLQAARRVQDRVDAVDLNLGCPQGIAKRGNYGAFLLPGDAATEAAKTALLVRIVATLHAGLTVPVTCKIRVLSSFDATLRLVLALQAAGCAVLTIHGRRRDCLKERVGPTDWETIARVKAHPAVTLPIVANGGVACFEDVAACAAATGADGVMTSEAILENPGLLSDRVCSTGGAGESAGVACPAAGAVASSLELALQYCDLAEAYPGADMGCVRAHLIKMLFAPLDAFTDLRDALVGCKASVAQCRDVVLRVRERYTQQRARSGCPPLPWPLPAPPAGWTLQAAAAGAAGGGGGGSGAPALPLDDAQLDAAAAAAEAALTARLVAACSSRSRSSGAGAGAGSWVGGGDAEVAAPEATTASSSSSSSCEEGGAAALSHAQATAASGGGGGGGGGDALEAGGRPSALQPLLQPLARMLLAWTAIRAAHPAAGLAHPAFACDVGVPGLWYMRYRRGVLGLAPKPSSGRRAAPPTTKELLEGAGAGAGAATLDGSGSGSSPWSQLDAAAAAAVAAAATLPSPQPPPPQPSTGGGSAVGAAASAAAVWVAADAAASAAMVATDGHCAGGGSCEPAVAAATAPAPAAAASSGAVGVDNATGTGGGEPAAAAPSGPPPAPQPPQLHPPLVPSSLRAIIEAYAAALQQPHQGGGGGGGHGAARVAGGKGGAPPASPPLDPGGKRARVEEEEGGRVEG